MGDDEYVSGATKYMRAPFSGEVNKGDWGFQDVFRYSGTQGFRHNNATNVAYADGHVETVRMRYTNTTDATPVAENTGFLSEDNSAYDLR